MSSQGNALMESNLSKTKPALRTKGNVTGNFGVPKVKAGANNEIGMTDKDFVNIVSQDEYLNRMYQAFDNTDSPRLKQFCYTQIRDILVQRNVWGCAS